MACRFTPHYTQELLKLHTQTLGTPPHHPSTLPVAPPGTLPDNPQCLAQDLPRPYHPPRPAPEGRLGAGTQGHHPVSPVLAPPPRLCEWASTLRDSRRHRAPDP